MNPREEGLLVCDDEFCRKDAKSAKSVECVVSDVCPPSLALLLLLLLLFVLPLEQADESNEEGYSSPNDANAALCSSRFINRRSYAGEVRLFSSLLDRMLPP